MTNPIICPVRNGLHLTRNAVADFLAQDIGDVWGPRRLHALAVYGEGPHVTALALLPVAILALDYALEHRRPLAVFGAALSLAASTLLSR